MASRIGLNLVSLESGQGESELEGRLRIAAGAGFKAAGLRLKDLASWEKQKGDIKGLRRLLEELGLAVAEVGCVAVCSADGKVASRRKEFGAAASLDAACVVCAYNSFDAPIKKAREQWSQFVESVAGYGVRPALDFPSDSPRFNTLDDALDIVSAGPPLGGVVVDTFHFWRGHSKITSLAQINPEQIVLVRLSDARNVPREQASDKDRTYPGRGILPLNHILSTILGTGYQGTFDVQLCDERHAADPARLAKAAAESARRAIEKAESRRV